MQIQAKVGKQTVLSSGSLLWAPGDGDITLAVMSLSIVLKVVDRPGVPTASNVLSFTATTAEIELVNFKNPLGTYTEIGGFNHSNGTALTMRVMIHEVGGNLGVQYSLQG